MTEHHTPIPGFTSEQSWALVKVADEAAERAIAKMRSNGCPVGGCEERGELQAVVFGAAKAGVVSLDARVADVERVVANLRRLLWVSISALATSLAALIITLMASNLGG